ncbi:hypothetical protein KQ51_01148 [Candidatus Izimaplasma bacterium HR1]|jgi:predicted GNAT family acetyltransferase|uniref:GNAT family N-acetyltransferase n=1 Tax=Candidatus Izimoplasma sp. HR1 TaxID=1541959 RepID=UPI0004F82FD2|nr:hypothetical protein KQ51_01148 [Candidatus Izimaplasma bacterium HR1]
MIRKLTELDRTKVLDYLYKEASYNIFIIGDIEAFGFDKDFQTIYGEIENNEFISVQLFYNEHAIYYANKTVFNTAYLDIYKNHKFNYMSGKEELMTLIKPHLSQEFNFKPMHFCQATSIDIEVEITEEIKLVKTKEDVIKLYNLLITINEFGIQHKSLEDFIKSTEKGLEMGTKLYVEKDGKMVSTVATTADTTINAMVVGVATDTNYRKQGYASQLMISLMKEYIINKKKDLCLFYDNPKAGKIYKRLGFKDVGKWVMMSDVEGN